MVFGQCNGQECVRVLMLHTASDTARKPPCKHSPSMYTLEIWRCAVFLILSSYSFVHNLKKTKNSDSVHMCIAQSRVTFLNTLSWLQGRSGRKSLFLKIRHAQWPRMWIFKAVCNIIYKRLQMLFATFIWKWNNFEGTKQQNRGGWIHFKLVPWLSKWETTILWTS